MNEGSVIARFFATCFAGILMWFIIFLGIYFCSSLLGATKSAGAWTAIVVATVLTTIGVFGANSENCKAKQALATEKLEIRHQVSRHFTALRRNLERNLKYNDYGAISTDKRATAVEEFLASVGCNPVQLRKIGALYSFVYEQVELLATNERKRGFDVRAAPQDGLDFEFWVAEALEKFGWKAKPTVGSGDQGVDIVAFREGKKLVIQCKRYSGKVSNKAVQEIVAGKGYYDAQDAAVITTGEYTTSAKQLAGAHHIYLLHVSDIPSINSIIS